MGVSVGRRVTEGASVAALTISGGWLACGPDCITNGSDITPWVVVAVNSIRVGGMDVGMNGIGDGATAELVSRHPLSTNQNKNKRTTLFFNGWMVFKVSL